MRAARNALSIAAAAAAAFVMLASPALAGSYVVSACSPSSSSGLWAQTNTYPAGVRAGNLCGGPAMGPLDGGNNGSLHAEDVLVSATNIPDGARAGWTFHAPAGTAITAISYNRHLAAYNDPNMFSGLLQADGVALEQCKISREFGTSNVCAMPNNQAPVAFAGLNTSSLFVGVVCRLVTNHIACIGGGTIHAARAAMYSARVTLSENSAPAVRDVGGALWGGGVVSGVVAVTFAASDATGIRDAVVRSDTGASLASASQACDFMLAQPCPQQPSGSVGVDTRRVPDGPRTFSLVVTDAAGNSQVVTSPTIVVDNDGPPPPASFSATPKGDGSNVIALAWRNPLNPPSPIAVAQARLCQLACAPAITVSPSGAAQVTAPAPGPYTVALWLVDAQGRGGPQRAALARVTVPPPPARGSSTRTSTRIVAVLEGRRLRVTGTIARTGRVRVSWRSKLARRTLGHGSRAVTIRRHRLRASFTLTAGARRGTIRIAIRSGRRIVAQGRARRR